MLRNEITVNCFQKLMTKSEPTGTETLVTVLMSLLGSEAKRTATNFEGKAK